MECVWPLIAFVHCHVFCRMCIHFLFLLFLMDKMVMGCCLLECSKLQRVSLCLCDFRTMSCWCAVKNFRNSKNLFKRYTTVHPSTIHCSNSKRNQINHFFFLFIFGKNMYCKLHLQCQLWISLQKKYKNKKCDMQMMLELFQQLLQVFLTFNQ